MIRSLIGAGIGQRGRHTFETVFDRLEVIKSLEQSTGVTIEKDLSSLNIKLIVKQAKNNRDSMIAQNLALSAKKFFGSPIDFIGILGYNNNI